MLSDPIKALEAYVNQPSGSHDRDDVTAMADMIAADFASLGFSVERHEFEATGPVLVCRIGRAERLLTLMGHVDTVFPHDVAVPFTHNGDGTASGSGATPSANMSGGAGGIKTMKRADFEKLDPASRMARMKDGYKITD